MPIRIQADLPAIEVLESENIFVMTHERAALQDIRPLKIAILNLMPTKIETETQLLRLLGNTPLQVDVELLHMASHVSRNTSSYHLNTFYKTFNDVKDQRFDRQQVKGFLCLGFHNARALQVILRRIHQGEEEGIFLLSIHPAIGFDRVQRNVHGLASALGQGGHHKAILDN